MKAVGEGTLKVWNSLDEVVARLQEAKKALVIGHVMPDGDAVSSVSGLTMILNRIGVHAVGCIADEVPWYFCSLPGAGEIVRPVQLQGKAFDTTITVDASDLARIGDATDLLQEGMPDIMLDHHATNVGFGRLNHCDPHCAATAMIVQAIAERLVTIDRELAQSLLLGIATDTGFFRHANTDEKVLLSAAQLVGLGARIQPIATAALEHRSLSSIKLLAAMLNTIQVVEEGRLAYGQVNASMLEETGCTEEDTVGFVAEIHALHGVEVAILFIEASTGQVHVSLRSKSYVDVGRVATALGGGGHPRAAGCTLRPEHLEQVIDHVLTAVAKALRGCS